MPLVPFPRPIEPRDPGANPAPTSYAMLCFDRDGVEADDPPEDAVPAGAAAASDAAAPRLLSRRICDELLAARQGGHPYTDVFVFCHGWLADYEGAVRTYSAWLAACEAVRPTATLDALPSYRPLVVALHWPSRPNTVWRRRAEAPLPFGALPHPPEDGVRAEPRRRANVLDVAAAIVPTASFYTMKRRSGRIGRHAVARVVAAMQAAAGSDVRVHMMGHSFGAKLVAEVLADRDGVGVRPVESMFLIEGALSAWAFSHARRNPYGDPNGTAVRVFSEHMVRGAVVASTSRFDFALGTMFPSAQAIEVAFRRLRAFSLPFTRLRMPGRPDVPPRLGAIGVWSFAGVEEQQRVTLRTAADGGLTADYGFRPGIAHHVVSDAVVNTAPTVDADGVVTEWDEPLVGAHSNIAHPEVAAAYWQVVLASHRPPQPPSSTSRPSATETLPEGGARMQ